MRTFHLFTRLLLVAIIIQFISCNKGTDFSTADSLNAVSQSNVIIDLSPCKIRRTWQDYAGERITALFTYNSRGNPISLLHSNNGTGNPDYYFFYNNQNRLIELRKTYGFGTFTSELHRYGYNSAGVCIADTMTFVEGITFINASSFVYDSQGRIIKETIKNIKNTGGALEPTRNPTFTYDSRGNLAVAGWKSSMYDYKINPLRINPIFQFLMRNYSQNNPAPQAKYNSKGLPLSWNPTNDGFFNAGVIYSFIYDCP